MKGAGERGNEKEGERARCDAFFSAVASLACAADSEGYTESCSFSFPLSRQKYPTTLLDREN